MAKPNSCLYRAVKRVVEYQFGISDLKSDVFDKYNLGEGVPTDIIVSVINEALSGHGIEVAGVYGKITDPENFDRQDLIRPPQFVKGPCIGHADGHAEGVLPTDQVFKGSLAITLQESQKG